MTENIPKYPDIGCLSLAPVDEHTKPKLLNVTWSSYFDIDLKRIQMLKIDVASFSSCLLFAKITDSL